MPSVSAQLAAANLVLLLASMVVCAFFAIRLYSGEITGYARRLAIGIVLVSGGLALHRMYWSANRLLEVHGQDYLLTSLYRDWAWLTLIPIAVMVAGYGVHLSPVLECVLGRWWEAKYGLSVLALWVGLIAWIPGG